MNDTTTEKYMRTGDRIHRASCGFGYAKSSVHWRFADGMTPDKVAAAITPAPWLSLCKRCWKD